MRLLNLAIHEPLPGNVLPVMADAVGEEEAVRRYKAIVLTTLRQLRGLTHTRIRVVSHPEDADEALCFWLLPRLADRWQAEDGVFRAEGWEIDFGGGRIEAAVRATGNICCPYLGARWVHAAMLGLERGFHQVVSFSSDGTTCFQARGENAEMVETRTLPELALVRSDEEWTLAMEGPLGAALRKAREAESR